jgi:hypothetical protein
MITPDPIQNGPEAFTNLIVFKSACIISQAEYKKNSVSAGWKVVDDKSSIDGSNLLAASKNSVETFCSMYNKTLEEFKSGNQYAGKAIMTPFSSPGQSWGYPRHDSLIDPRYYA